MADSESSDLDQANKIPKMLLAGGLLVILAIYSMGWSGTLHFDDEPNLNGLYGISDWASALRFVVSGEAGPTGRPVSLATFAVQHESWPDPLPFLVVNTGLHLINAILCFLLVSRLLRWILPDPRRLEWLALGVTLLWAASPLLASSSLVVVQRMTGLSGFFVLLFLWLYILGRPYYRRGSPSSNLRVASIIGGGTLLAGFSKENGFLLPVFVLLIEWLVVPGARARLQPLARPFFLVVLAAPAVAIAAYLVYRGLVPSGYEFREYTLLERLLTQPTVLMDYMRQLIIPDPEAITPFHDNSKASSGLFSPAATALSLFAVLALLGLAWKIRRSHPLIAFGLFWFFAGHAVESTTVPLELYFPHRNYLPAVGFYLALVCVFVDIFQRFRLANWIRFSAAGGYFLVFCALLGYGTSLWGNHRLASEMWYIYNRDSVRAAKYLYQFYSEADEAGVADQLNRRFIEQYPGNALFSIQSLVICDHDAEAFSRKIERVVDDLKNEPSITVSLAGPIQQYAAVAGESDCPHFGVEQATRLVQAALEDEHRLVHPMARQHLLFAQAQLADQRDAYDEAIDALQRAMAIAPVLDAVLLIAYFHVENGDREEAVHYLEQIIENPPVGHVRKVVWRSRLRELLDSLR